MPDSDAVFTMRLPLSKSFITQKPCSFQALPSHRSSTSRAKIRSCPWEKFFSILATKSARRGFFTFFRSEALINPILFRTFRETKEMNIPISFVVKQVCKSSYPGFMIFFTLCEILYGRCRVTITFYFWQVYENSVWNSSAKVIGQYFNENLRLYGFRFSW